MSRGNLVYGTEVDFSAFNWNKQELEQLEETIYCIEDFLTKPISNENFQQLFNYCFFLIDKIPLPVLHVDSIYLVRARPNYNGEVFSEETDVSYNSKRIDLIKPGRFNRPTESMFYGAIPSDKQEQTVATVTLESCKEIIDDKSTVKSQYFTFGKWNIKNHFPVLNLCFHDNALCANPGLKKFAEEYLNDVGKIVDISSMSFLKRYWYFFSDLACKKHSTDQQYFITTAFICALKIYYEEDFNGIIYSSSMTEMEGVNIVMTPKAVDKFLELKEVFMYKYARDPNNFKSFRGYQCSNVSNVFNRKFCITSIV